MLSDQAAIAAGAAAGAAAAAEAAGLHPGDANPHDIHGGSHGLSLLPELENMPLTIDGDGVGVGGGMRFTEHGPVSASGSGPTTDDNSPNSSRASAEGGPGGDSPLTAAPEHLSLATVRAKLLLNRREIGKRRRAAGEVSTASLLLGDLTIPGHEGTDWSYTSSTAALDSSARGSSAPESRRVASNNWVSRHGTPAKPAASLQSSAEAAAATASKRKALSALVDRLETAIESHDLVFTPTPAPSPPLALPASAQFNPRSGKLRVVPYMLRGRFLRPRFRQTIPWTLHHSESSGFFATSTCVWLAGSV
eukprot:COSAG05_NODE_3262_length_2195_cov_19.051527_2_plen_307_part_00